MKTLTRVYAAARHTSILAITFLYRKRGTNDSVLLLQGVDELRALSPYRLLLNGNGKRPILLHKTACCLKGQLALTRVQHCRAMPMVPGPFEDLKTLRRNSKRLQVSRKIYFILSEKEAKVAIN
jgi:hypothetical protein